MSTEYEGTGEDTTEIDGSRVVYTFRMYYHKWECDGWGWVTEDGRMYASNHGRVHEVTTGLLVKKADELNDAVRGILKALALNADARGDSENGETVE